MAMLLRPDLPAGPRRELSEALHDLHHQAGWPSLRAMAREVGCSYTTVSAAFSMTRLPKWGLLELLVETLNGDTEQFHQLWLAAGCADDNVTIEAVQLPAAEDRADKRGVNRKAAALLAGGIAAAIVTGAVASLRTFGQPVPESIIAPRTEKARCHSLAERRGSDPGHVRKMAGIGPGQQWCRLLHHSRRAGRLRGRSAMRHDRGLPRALPRPNLAGVGCRPGRRVPRRPLRPEEQPNRLLSRRGRAFPASPRRTAGLQHDVRPEGAGGPAAVRARHVAARVASVVRRSDRLVAHPPVDATPHAPVRPARDRMPSGSAGPATGGSRRPVGARAQGGSAGGDPVAAWPARRSCSAACSGSPVAR
jgi:hypothetical protein